mmetsp:Transcript_3114/g.3258  ORF Transcript_3114/g.3258 Transcript_3114/m.3258 type:complete len:112 (-) Transcript_3114:1048-1383(-)
MAEFSSSSAIVEAVNLKTKDYVSEKIDPMRSQTITTSDIETSKLPGFISKHVGKVRDVYKCDDFIVIVATDRQSAFDRQLTSVPFKGTCSWMSHLYDMKHTSMAFHLLDWC